MVTFANSFHATSTRSRKSVGDVVPRAYVKRVERRLCGMADCCCSGDGGTRHSKAWFEPLDGGGRAYLIRDDLLTT